MNKIFKTLSASILMALALTACQKEEFRGNEAEGIYTFKVSADNIATKAAIDGDGNGTAVNRFIMEVYLAKPTELVLLDRQVKAPTADSPKSTSFNLTLIKDQEYKVLFWADKGDDSMGDLYYKTTDNLQNVSFLNAARKGNNDALDAFSKMEVITRAESKAGFSKSVQLTRPFGQVNFITTDIPAINNLSGGSQFLPTDVKVSYTTYTGFNVLTQTGTGSEDIEYTAPVYSAMDPATNPAKYTLSMDYMLTATSEKETRPVVKLTALAGNYELTTVEVTNYPVQRNYRTNIIGNLLTTTNEFVVEVDPMWTNESDLSFVAPGLIVSENGEYHIQSAEGLRNFSRFVNGGNSLSGKIVVLDANVDLENAEWTPVGQTGATQFMGTFNGNGYTISNLRINNTDDGGNCATGLFGWLNSAIVKNIKISGANITGHHNVGTIAGYLETSGCTIESCTVENAIISCTSVNSEANGDKCGGIVGHAGNGGVKVKDCVVKNSSISAGRDAGQVVGAALTENVDNCSATNVTVTANDTSTGANIREEVIGRVL